MDDDSSSSSDNLRANWTPPLDHYFIDLLVDQVRRGNKTGHVFSKQAWTEMITLFNTKFGFKYDTDVLKNRYKRLRKQYNDIKILLGQSGFSWDETRQMVTADDHIWDEYTEAHPDTQPYRVKVVPYYNELSIICGHAIADGRYSLSCYDVDFNDEGGYGVDEKRTDGQTPTNDDRTKIDWSQTMDQYFLELMLNHVHKGNKNGRTFNKKAWAHMITSFNAKFGFQHGKVILKSRYNILRRQYSCIKTLVGQKGFTWDETQQIVIADDCVWNNYIKVHPNFRRYRNTTMPSYRDMCTICGNETTPVNKNITCCNLTLENGNPGKNIVGVSIPIVNADSNESQKKASDSGGDKDLSDQHKRCPLGTPQTFQQSKRARRIDEGMADVLREMEVAVISLTKKKENENFISTKNVIDALQALPDIDDDLLLDACDFLEDEKKAKMFLALDVTLRKKWLMRKLRP
ncbi:hypothetical protein L1049_008758 [Liquidambar formosana]|uniref:L10-interacting MYB domain-containing protein n=1 Tax=Liquidambar formosana TaxID=63359 RepID=A0AAP0X5V3_LIQFO